MPLHPARPGIQRDERGEIEVGAPSRRALGQVIRPAVAGADDHQPGFGVIVDRIPRGAAAADVPAALGVPGLRGSFQIRMVLRPQRRIARDGVEPPLQLARGEIIGGYIAAHIVFRAAIADYHHVARHFGRAGGIDPALLVIHGIGLPDDLAGLRVQRVKLRVEAGDIDLAISQCDAAIGHVAADRAVDLHVDRGFKPPQLLAGRRIECIGPARHAAGVHHPALHHRRRFQHAVGAKVRFPRQPQPLDIGGGDVGQHRMPGLARIAAGIGPVFTSLSLLRRRGFAGRTGRQRHRENECKALHHCPCPHWPSHGLFM